MYMVKINNNYYKMLDKYSLQNSSSEVKYSNVTVDFDKGTFLDLPLQYQEVQILSGTQQEIEDGKGIVKYFGYVESYELSTIKTSTDPKELTLSLLSPMKLATLRTVNINGYYDIDTLLNLVLEPLIEEGYVIKEKHIHSRAFTVQFVMQTVEYCMNSISNAKNIFWYINELKEIFLYDISYLIGLETKLEISENNKPKGLLGINPTLVSVDYANILNLKKARTFFYSYNGSVIDETRISNFVLTDSPKVVQSGDTISFNYPVVIDEDTLKKISSEENLKEGTETSPTSKDKYGIYIEISLLSSINSEGNDLNENEIIRTAYIYWDSSQNKLVTSGNISFSNDGSEEQETEFVLQRDNFFANLITGIKWNNKANEGNGSITEIYSHSALKYTTTKVFFNEEIEKCKGIISKTGKIEKVIDLNERWYTERELIEYARSLIIENGNTCNEVGIITDIPQDIQLGSLVNINMPNFFVVGNFIVTSIKENYIGPMIRQYTYELRNTSILDNFIDFFRSNSTQEGTSEVDDIMISTYTEDIINQSYVLEVDE